MTEQQGPILRPGVIEETKHSRKLRLAGGALVSITRGDALHALTLYPYPGSEAPESARTVYLSGHDLRALASEPGPDTCGNCFHGRADGNGYTRCHRSGPRKRGDETFWPRVQLTEWCAKHRRLVPAPAVAS